MGYQGIGYTEADLKAVLKAIKDQTDAQAKAEDDLLALRITNMEKLFNLQAAQLSKQETLRLEREQVINEKLIKMGFDARAVVEKEDFETRMANLRAEMEERRSQAQAVADETGKSLDEVLADIDKEYAARSEKENELQEQINAADEARRKLEDKENKKRLKNLKKTAQSEFGNLGDVMFKNSKDMVADMVAEGATQEEAEKAVRSAKAQAVYDKLADFAKQLESQINDIAYAQTEIDTRLYGSGNKTRWGSYWKHMNSDIIKSVGMNPFVKQADVVNNLKTLVGKGIAFNVEQRAFLDTISDKIATTFEATDATLLKLVRIQQADTTAARLGMEAALTAFLNNMYETTEYMSSAAESIRTSLYEASALMGAAEATGFEYQVQKWLGSLYSVGFSNTEGLAGALGKLASGNISGLTDGGFGNLLIMAANRANLSIADILAKGLDDSETNQLMKAMVEYLGDIYAETKNSKVVQQQFANVFGLTASDLKAAANLFGSTGDISKYKMNYGGMMANLQNMANSMYSRMSTGAMMSNLLDNLKFATASTMANNPVLYTIYSIASILDSTVGGVAIPAFSVMGNMVDLETTIANLMRVGALAGGFFGGIGQMIAGLAQGKSANMLANFGIEDSKLITLTRGRGTGISAISGRSLSESGQMAGQSDASDIQNKTMQDANEQGENDLQDKVDKDNETKLSTVDQHIINIYNLLESVVTGTRSLKVDMGNEAAWSMVLGGRLP